MTKQDLENYFFPDVKTNKIRNLYFDKLKSLVGIENFWGYEDYSDDDRVKAQEKCSRVIADYIRKNENDMLIDIIEVYDLIYPNELGEILLHSIVVDEVLKTKTEDYDVYYDNNSLLYFDNKYPILLKKQYGQDILGHTRFMQVMVSATRDYFAENPPTED